jgi:polyisoprenoid-binding protein YceI
VKKKAWLNVPAFPTAKFVFSTVKRIGRDRYEAAGQLTIKSISQDIRAPLTIKTTAGATTFEGVFTLLRLQFRVGEGAWSNPTPSPMKCRSRSAW